MSSKHSMSVQSKKRNINIMKRDNQAADVKVSDNVVSNTLEEDQDEVDDDELDLENVSSRSDAEGDDEDDSDVIEKEESDDDFPRKRKSKMSKHDDGSNDFSSAVTAILSSHLKAYDRKDPIMARNKKVLKKNEEDKLEQQARKQLLVEKKKLLSKSRKLDIIPVASEDNSGEEIRKILEKEAKLRKVAQKGVIKLFNAILSTQVKTDKEVNSTLGDITNRNEKKQLITEVSKEKFLDLVKAAGDDA
ncbi:hypothetical protein TPHA_0D03210 [Tetrapisispora phaffii CBS 4417]|uniref:Rrp15p-domain-containing protein n=1 Tax=Tetrapisispora phaffii (strain ATCC 24235 / CBS 4417 / NBRC 1672 / NRRL Y-8282 / UCD 70-5) TaxID=1071381 RepID=G8BSY6_TETPH|nr:hypothetical protein TPHA_0D03210 [Tetrapisispora phaffii CBS 4417]CCE62957.1 hypothetical protein TPHA_0D03210 [Tetrapisispora phaffii CBS 4417]